MYVYSRNQTLLEIPLDELRQIEGLKVSYVQIASSHKCMPVGGSLGYDTFMTYTFVNMFGYGNDSGYLRTILREDSSMLEIDLGEDFKFLGSSGEGIWGHTKNKLYILFSTLTDLAYMALLVLATCKVLLHSLARIQTKQMFARDLNLDQQPQNQPQFARPQQPAQND